MVKQKKQNSRRGLFIFILIISVFAVASFAIPLGFVAAEKVAKYNALIDAWGTSFQSIYTQISDNPQTYCSILSDFGDDEIGKGNRITDKVMGFEKVQIELSGPNLNKCVYDYPADFLFDTRVISIADKALEEGFLDPEEYTELTGLSVELDVTQLEGTQTDKTSSELKKELEEVVSEIQEAPPAPSNTEVIKFNDESEMLMTEDIPAFAGEENIPAFAGEENIPAFAGEENIPAFAGEENIPAFAGEEKNGFFVIPATKQEMEEFEQEENGISAINLIFMLSGFILFFAVSIYAVMLYLDRYKKGKKRKR